MHYPPEWIQKLKDSVSLIEIASENIDLKKSGNGQRFMGRCPFHGDRSPSLSVSKDFYHCFGCKVSGDVIRFTMELHGLSFEEACEELAEKANLPLPQTQVSSEVERANAARRKTTAIAAKLNLFSTLNYYQPNLTAGTASPLFQVARDYLSQRGITLATTQEFQLGVASHLPDSLTKFLTQSKAPLPVARQVGLIRSSQKTTGDYDMFRERLIFPLIDVRGRVCGFGGRLLTAAQDQPKYLNSPESDLFQKSKFLYGLFQAKKWIREEEVAIVVEGYFDVIGMHQNQFKNVVATCGTSLSEDHVKTLSRLAKKIVIFFDRDEAGESATEKAMLLGLKMGQIFYGVPHFTDLDVDEFLNSKEAQDPQAKVKEALARTFALLDQKIEQLMSQSEGAESAQTEKRAQALKTINGWLQEYADPIGRSVRVDHLIKHWGVSSEALGSLVGAMRVSNARAAKVGQEQFSTHPVPSRPVSKRPQPVPKVPATDLHLMKYFVKFEKFAAQFLEVVPKLPENYSLSALFFDTTFKEFVEGLSAKAMKNQLASKDFEEQLGHEKYEKLRPLILGMLWAEGQEQQVELLNDLLNGRVKQVWAQFSHEVRRKMAQAEASQDLENFEKLSKQFLDLQRKLKELEESYVSNSSIE